MAHNRHAARRTRHKRVRTKVQGTQERPRLSVYRSLKHMSAQIIDDTSETTLVAASTLAPEIRDAVMDKSKTEAAGKLGELLAEKAKQAGIKQVVFDRGGYKYHGRVKSLAESARKKGLKF